MNLVMDEKVTEKKLPAKKRAVIEVCLITFILLVFSAYIIHSSDNVLTGYTVINEATASNHAPVWIGKKLNFSIAPDSFITFDLKNYFSDEDDDELTFLAASAQNLTIFVDNELVKIVPGPEFRRTAVITLIASDMKSTIRQEILLFVQEGISPEEQIILNSQAFVDKELIYQFEMGDVVEAIIFFNTNTSAQNLSALLTKESLERLKQDFIEQSEVDFGYHFADPNSYDLEIKKEYALLNAVAVKLTRRGFNKLKENPEIEGILSDKLFRIASGSYNLEMIGVPALHDEGITGESAAVCILDTGASPDAGFKEQLVGGYDFVNNDNLPVDDHNHGTHVAGILNSVAPKTKIVSVKVCDASGSCSASNVLSGIDYCLENKELFNISVISGSFGDGKAYSRKTCPGFFDSVLQAVEEAGFIAVFASGNEGSDGVNYPACSIHSLSVGAVNSSDEIAEFSNKGPALDILAPGVDVNSTLIEGYGLMSGTSMAVPHVAGVAALLQSRLNAVKAGNTSQDLSLPTARILFKETGYKIGNYSRIDSYAAAARFFKNYTISKTNFFVQKAKEAKIQFKQPVDMEGITECSRISQNHVEIFSEKCPQYNISAEITIWGINVSAVSVLQDNKPCPETICTNVHYENNTASFDVSGFTSYQVADLTSEFGTAGTPVLNCQDIASSGVYDVSGGASLDAGASGSDCFVVTADDVWFNCFANTAFFSADSGFAPGIGFNVQNVSNFTLINCNVRNFEKAVYFYNVTNSSLSFFNTSPVANTFFNNTLAGVVLNISHNNSITENSIYNSSRIGIHLYNSSNNTLLNNFVYNHTIGIWLNNSHNNSLLDHEDNRFNGHNNISMLFIDSFDNLLGSTAGPWSNFTTPVIFQNSTHGGINYSFGLNLSDNTQYFVSNYVRIEENFTRVDSVNAPRLNRSATLSFWNLNLVNPHPVYDAEDDGTYITCPTGDVDLLEEVFFCAVSSVSDSSAVYNTTHFTTFGLTNNATTTAAPAPTGTKGSPRRVPPAVRKIPLPVIIPVPPPLPAPPPSPQVQTPDVIGIPLAQELLRDTPISCGYVLDSFELRPLGFTSLNITEEVKNSVPAGYEIIQSPLALQCAGEDLDLTFNLPADYKSIRALRCNKNGCVDLAKEISENELICGGKTIREIRTAELSKRKDIFWDPVPELALEYGKVLTNYDKTISLGDYQFSFLEYLRKDITVQLETPKLSVPQPQNPSISIIGSPIQLVFEKEPPELKAELIMPFVEMPNFYKEELAVYWLEPEAQVWKRIGGSIKESVVSVIIDLKSYLKDNKATFAVQGIKCDNCLASEFKKIYNPNSRDAVVLVHGFTSSPVTWQFVIDDFVLNKQPFQIWTFGYPSTYSMEQISEELVNYLELNANEYDALYFIGHSLGGMVVQEALQQAYAKNKYALLNKFRKAVLVGVPNEGSPAAEVYYNLFNHFLNKQSIIKLFNVDSFLVKQISAGKIIPRIPGVSYDVVAGTAPYLFNLGLFTFTTEKALKFIEPNDGVITVASAQHVGKEYINNSCSNFFSLNVSHTDLIDDPISRLVVEKRVTEEIMGRDTQPALLGFNKYARLLVTDCKSGDLIVVAGRRVDSRGMPDPLNCNCGNGFCGIGETIESCPQDCAIISKINTIFKGRLLIIIYSAFTFIFSLVLVLIIRKLGHIYRKKNIKYIKRELEEIKEHLED